MRNDIILRLSENQQDVSIEMIYQSCCSKAICRNLEVNKCKNSKPQQIFYGMPKYLAADPYIQLNQNYYILGITFKVSEC